MLLIPGVLLSGVTRGQYAPRRGVWSPQALIRAAAATALQGRRGIYAILASTDFFHVISLINAKLWATHYFTWYAAIQIIQVDALREYYDILQTTNEKNLARANFVGLTVIPIIAISFVVFYWTMGILKYYQLI